jgi:hypothetical protein
MFDPTGQGSVQYEATETKLKWLQKTRSAECRPEAGESGTGVDRSSPHDAVIDKTTDRNSAFIDPANLRSPLNLCIFQVTDNPVILDRSSVIWRQRGMRAVSGSRHEGNQRWPHLGTIKGPS